jgi:predicted DNA-binding transcriptional regulator AlpA|tara:strand:+ start:8227 stop:8466 length:240 start_codon:yes stop_codon:yes gene_type:complete
MSKRLSEPDQWSQNEQPLGVQEIAELLGYKKTTVSSWRQRKQFPVPDHTVANNTVGLWKKSTVINWANATGRNKTGAIL